MPGFVGSYAKGFRHHRKKWNFLRENKSKGGLRFRDLKTFNKAWLTKQIWRLMENPNSLVGVILKSKYFSSSNVLSTKLGHNHSHIWHGFKESIFLVKASMLWR